MATTKQKIAKLKDIEHLVERGSLIKFTYDTEIYNLDKTFPGIYDFGALIEDLAGNEIGAPVHYLRQPKDTLHSVVSNLITRSFPEDHPDAVDFKTFVGKTADTLDRFYEYTWDRYRDEQKIKYVNKGHQKENEETVRLFPLEDENGDIKHVRLHEGGRRVSFQVPDHSENWNYIEVDDDGNKTKWRKTYASAEMRGYANTTADDPWIWSTLYMAMYPEIYKTHTKNEHKFRQDLFPAMVGHILWGDKGENGLRPGSRYHPIKEKMVTSLKQSDFIPANTRNEGAFHERGVHLRDGSDYDADQAHGTIADVRGTSASENRARDVNPEIAKHFELMADPSYAREFIMKGAASERYGFRARPLLAFGRYNLEDGPTSHLGICIETDERYGNRSNAVILKTDVDWSAIKDDKGRSILDIKHKETLKKLIRSQIFNKFGKQDSLLEITHTKKTPKVYDGQKALESGAHKQEQFNLALRNANKIRKNANFRDAIMEVYQDGIPQMKALMEKPNPLDDELKDNFTGKPYYFEIEDKNGKVRIVDERNELYEHALNEWNTGIKNDHFLQDLIRPHSIEWCEEDDAEQELERFNKVLAKARAEFDGAKGFNNRDNRGHKDRPPVHIPLVHVPKSKALKDESKSLSQIFSGSAGDEVKKPLNQAQAKAYITRLRFQALWADYNDDPSFRFNDNSWKVEITDRDGHMVNWDAYHALTPKERSNKWKNGDLDVKLQPIAGHSVRRIARMMCESGEMQHLMDNFADLARDCDTDTPEGQAEKEELIDKLRCLYKHKELYEARSAFLLHGYPNIPVEKQPYLTIEKARNQAHEILQNLKVGKLHQCGVDEIGALEFMADHKDEAEKVLTRYLTYLDKKEKDVPPPTPAQYRMLGIDPVSGDPLPFIKYAVNPKKTLEIACPDGLAEKPFSNDEIGACFTIIELPKGMSAQKINKKLSGQDDLVLVSEKTGERRLAAKAKILPLWDEGQDHHFEKELDKFRKSYNDIDARLPINRERLAIVKMEDNPQIAGLRGDGRYVNTNLQALHVPDSSSRRPFLGMLSRKLGNVSERVTGMVVPTEDLKQPIEKGAIRIREMKGEELSGREIEHEVTKVSQLNMKRVMAAFALLEETPNIDAADYDLEGARDLGFNDKAQLNQYISAVNNHSRYGFTSKLDMYDSLIGLFTQNRQNVMKTPEKYNVSVIDLRKDIKATALRETMAYFDLYNRPKASISEHATSAKKQDKGKAAYLYAGAYPAQPPSHES